jgi:hypothetical protein
MPVLTFCSLLFRNGLSVRVAVLFFLSKRAKKHSYENVKFNIFRSFS